MDRPVFVLLLALALPVAAQDRTNVFDDPFVQLTHGLPSCPVPTGPLLTRDEANAEAHGRSQRGVSCYLDGRCRLANSYLYDKEIMPRVEIAMRVSGRFDADTNVWALGQRRQVWLKGCVSTPEQARELEQLVRRIDDVEGVLVELTVGHAGPRALRTSALSLGGSATP
jgi:osmotically-inducible protein OsmY